MLLDERIQDATAKFKFRQYFQLYGLAIALHSEHLLVLYIVMGWGNTEHKQAMKRRGGWASRFHHRSPICLAQIVNAD